MTDAALHELPIYLRRMQTREQGLVTKKQILNLQQ
jgi:hypothetical protein